MGSFSGYFVGKSVREAILEALITLPRNEIWWIATINDISDASITAVGCDEKSAIETVKSSVLKLKGSREKGEIIFDIDSAAIVKKGEKGILEIKAYSEEEAQRNWETDKPRVACLEKLECVSAPAKGFIGVGKKLGLWKAHWSTAFVAEINYKQLAMVEVRYNETPVKSKNRQISSPIRSLLMDEQLLKMVFRELLFSNLPFKEGEMIKLRANKEIIINNWIGENRYNYRIADYLVFHEERLKRFSQIAHSTLTELLTGTRAGVRRLGTELIKISQEATGVKTISLMQLCHLMMSTMSPQMASQLEGEWHGVGDWMA